MSASWAEERFVEEATRAGYEVHATGWPDFIIGNKWRVVFVEVKRAGESLKGNQLQILQSLEKLGLNVMISIDGALDNLVSLTEFPGKTRELQKRRDWQLMRYKNKRQQFCAGCGRRFLKGSKVHRG